MTTSEIRFTVMLPPFGDHATPSAFRRLATTAEEQGFDAVWFADHVTFPAEIPDKYPFAVDGTSPFESTDNAYDLFQVLAHVAAITDTVSLGANVCIAPYRHPVVLAKHALTIDSLSDGRFEFGVAPGWLRTEFEVLDVPFGERGSRLDEFLEIFTTACDQGEFAYDGEHYSFQTTGFHPRPVGEIPIWIGGDSPAAYRRIAEYGEGWSILWKRPEEIRETGAKIIERWNADGRSGTPGIAVMRPIHLGSESALDESRPLVGSADKVIDDIEQYAEVGTTNMVMDFFTPDVDEQIEQIERIGEAVLPSFRT